MKRDQEKKRDRLRNKEREHHFFKTCNRNSYGNC